MIEFKNVSKTFSLGKREVHAVKDVSLFVEKGEIYGIIGFSGAGKSTLLRLVNMLERPTAGSSSLTKLTSVHCQQKSYVSNAKTSA